MKTVMRVAVVLAFLVLVFGQSVRPSFALAWGWSFGSDAGQFITDGDGPTVGWFNVEDFIVTQSSRGGSLGSWSEGQYTPRGFWTRPPYRMLWDGNAVAQWDSDGLNTFDWLVFRDNLTAGYLYFFGWGTTNVNIPGQGAHYIDNGTSQVSYALNIHPVIALLSSVKEPIAAPVPEPATVLLLGMGLLAGSSMFRTRILKRREERV